MSKKHRHDQKITAQIDISKADWQMILDAVDFYDTEIYEFDAYCPNHQTRSAVASAAAKLRNMPLTDENRGKFPLSTKETAAILYSMQYTQEEVAAGNLELDEIPESLHDQSTLTALMDRLTAFLAALGIVFE